MGESEHLCQPGIFESFSSAKLKKLIGGRRRLADPFTCGGCFSTFTTICSLHIHCQKHNEGGSYYFDSLTRTAFPKYDTACVYTQVTADLLVQGHQSDQENHAQVESTELIQPDASSVRASKRIAKRKGKQAANEERRENENNITENQVIEYQDYRKEFAHVKHGYEVKDDGTEVERADSKTQMNNDTNSFSGLEITHSPVKGNFPEVKHQRRYSSRKRKAKKHGAEMMTDIISDDESVDEPGSKTKPTKNKTKTSFATETEDITIKHDIFTSDNHKNDELTASEVLLAISKGDSADLAATVLDKDTIDMQNTSKGTNESIDVPCFTDENSSKVKEHSRHAKSSRTSPRSKGTNRYVSDGLREYECKTCGKKGSNAMLTYHKYLHMDRKSFACDVCGLLFQIPRSLAIHKRQHEDKQFRCEHCPAAFHRKQYLETHLLKHTGENPFMCDLCGKSYRDRSHLKRHIKHVHENVRDFKCDICTEKFFRSDHLKNHRLRHFVADKKCQFCNRMFKHPEDLVRHTRTHTGEKEWFCHICGHGFVAVTPYYTHMAKKHSINKEEAKIWKNRSREELKHQRQYQNDSSVPAPTGKETTDNENYFHTATAETTEGDKGVVHTDTDLVPLKGLAENTSDVSTYVDLPVCDNTPIEKNGDVTEETFTGNNLLIKLTGTSEGVKTYTEEDILGMQGAVVTDLIQGSEVTVGEDVGGEMVPQIHDRDRLQLTGDQNEFNVIIAVDNMGFGAETVMFIDGEQCQSEVIIDN